MCVITRLEKRPSLRILLDLTKFSVLFYLHTTVPKIGSNTNSDGKIGVFFLIQKKEQIALEFSLGH